MLTSMTTLKIRRAASLLAEARLARRPFAALPEDCRPTDEAAAYQVQDALHAALTGAGHGTLAGHKIGCTTAVMQRFLGIDNPCAGGVFAPTVQQVDGRFAHAGFRHVGVECEIAVRLRRALPVAGAP
jgi:2-oxo-3-hexenedioate decarboxylase/2-keto-4-pentenoate hydratase